MPFPHLLENPEKRVAREERAVNDRLRDSKSTFSASLMTHNTQVAVFALALGMTWGVGHNNLVILQRRNPRRHRARLRARRPGIVPLGLAASSRSGRDPRDSDRRPGGPGPGLGLDRLGEADAAPRPPARNRRRSRYIDMRRGLAADLGGLCGSLSVAVSRTGSSLLDEDQPGLHRTRTAVLVSCEIEKRRARDVCPGDAGSKA